MIFKGVRTCIEYLENGIINREFQDTYFFVYHQPITNYKVQFAEIQALLPLEIEQGMALFSQETDKIEAVLYKIVGNQMNYTYQPQKIWITKNDFVQSTDNYFYTSMQLAKEILKNKSLSV